MSACEASNNGDASAVKAKVLEFDLAEKAKPSLCGVLGKENESGSFLFDSAPYQRSEVGMKRRTVLSVPFAAKCDGPRLKVDLAKWDGGFRQSASLEHCNQPAIAHPLVAGFKRLFDRCLFGCGDFGFLLRRVPSQSESDRGIGRNIAAADGFLHNRGEYFQFRQGGVVRSRFHQFFRWVCAKGRILGAKLIRDLGRSDHGTMRQKGANGGPSSLITNQGFFVRVFPGEEFRYPCVETIALRLLRERVFAHCLLGDGLLHFSQGSVSGTPHSRRLASPGSVRLLESNPVKGTARTRVIRSHECSIV